jgi:hypothetical protein
MRCGCGRWSHDAREYVEVAEAYRVSWIGAWKDLVVRSLANPVRVTDWVMPDGMLLCLRLTCSLVTSNSQGHYKLRIPSRNSASGESSRITFSMSALPHCAGSRGRWSCCAWGCASYFENRKLTYVATGSLACEIDCIIK